MVFITINMLHVYFNMGLRLEEIYMSNAILMTHHLSRDARLSGVSWHLLLCSLSLARPMIVCLTPEQI